MVLSALRLLFGPLFFSYAGTTNSLCRIYAAADLSFSISYGVLRISIAMVRPCNDDTFVADRQLSELAHHVADQLAYVQRMIVNGAPTQAAEDRLRELERRRDRLRPADHGSLREPTSSARPWR